MAIVVACVVITIIGIPVALIALPLAVVAAGFLGFSAFCMYLSDFIRSNDRLPAPMTTEARNSTVSTPESRRILPTS